MRKEQNKTILLVEDEAIIALSEKNQLERLGYRVLVAYTGEKSIEIFKNETSIDLVLMDIDLGTGIDGVDAGKNILSCKEIPLVFLSSHTEPEIVLKTEKISSYGYVVKNSGLTVLDASIQMAFKLFDAHRKVIENEERYRTLFENSHTIILLIDPETKKIADANQAAEAFYGWTCQELRGMDLSEITLQNEGFLNSEMKLLQNEKQRVYELQHRIKNGAVKSVEVRTGPISISNKQFLYSIVIDRTARKIVETLLKESETKYQAILDTVREAVFIIDTETLAITEANRSACSLYGYAREELIGIKHYELSAEPELTMEVAKEFQKEVNLQKYIRNRKHKKKDSTLFPVHIASSQFTVNGRRYIIAAVSEIENL